MKVIFSQRAFAAVLAETTEKIKTETGGLFLGVVRDDTWYIVEAIDPGPESIFEVAYFEYDRRYTQHLINKIANLYDQKLELIGLWHRHPGSFDQFSSTDDGTNIKYASMRKEGAISALVNIDPVFRLTMYHVDQLCRYRKISYKVGDDLIPKELLCYKSQDRFYDMMDAMLHGKAPKKDINKDGKFKSVDSLMTYIMPILDEYECSDDLIRKSSEDATEMLTDAFIEDLDFIVTNIQTQVKAQIENNTMIIRHEGSGGDNTIKLIYDSDEDVFVLYYGDKSYTYHSSMIQKACEIEQNTELTDDNDQQYADDRHRGVISALKRIIKSNRNEDTDDGYKDP